MAASPAEQGVDARGISTFLDAVEDDGRIEPHGLIVQRGGRRVFEGYWAPHSAGDVRLVYSLSKTFTGTALGLALGEGLLALDDLVADHLPELLQGADERTRRMQIRHIASMATGHDHETYSEALALDPGDPLKAFFTIPPDREPGTVFAYNQPPVMALAAVLQRRTGLRLTDYLRPRLLEPLGISGFGWAQAMPGLDAGFSGVHTTLDAVARLGQLYLDDGLWEGRRILPEGWVATASTVQIPNASPAGGDADWQQGYCFQLWRSRHGYRGDGAFGQFMVVLPESGTVVAMFSATFAMQAVLDHLWEHLLSALCDGALPPSDSDDELAERARTLSLPTAYERLEAGAPSIPVQSFRPAPGGAGEQPTVTGVDTDGWGAVVRESGWTVNVPLTVAWSHPLPWLATSATTLAGGRSLLDLVFLETPHRLEVELDPSTATFTTRWPVPPLRPGPLRLLRSPPA